MSKEVNTVGIYFCGGGGIKLGQRFSEGRQPSNNAFAKANFYFQDTSDATNKHMGDLNMYHYDDLRKGGGGVRQNVSEMVLDRVGQSLANQQPSDYNIVVHTLSGA